MPKPPLSLVSPATTIEPPGELGPPGRRLWDAVQAEFGIRDAGGIALLFQACSAWDTVEVLGEAIARDGAVIYVRGSARCHPAVKEQLTARALSCRLLEKLGVTLEPVKPLGRPPKSMGWRGDDA
jgi:hypothetical protein